MVPAAFVFLDRLPLSPNGKVDRAALPAAWQPRPATDVPYAAARTPEQRTLADLWSDVLGVHEVGMDDNFFEIGGDSLSSVEMLALASRAFGGEFSARDLIEHQTIAEFADLVTGRTPAQR
jgi:acyl carrier protein